MALKELAKPGERLKMTYEEFLAWADELPDSLFAFAEIANLPADVVQALRSLQRG